METGTAVTQAPEQNKTRLEKIKAFFEKFGGGRKRNNSGSESFDSEDRQNFLSELQYEEEVGEDIDAIQSINEDTREKQYKEHFDELQKEIREATDQAITTIDQPVEAMQFGALSFRNAAIRIQKEFSEKIEKTKGRNVEKPALSLEQRNQLRQILSQEIRTYVNILDADQQKKKVTKQEGENLEQYKALILRLTDLSELMVEGDTKVGVKSMVKQLEDRWLNGRF